GNDSCAERHFTHCIAFVMVNASLKHNDVEVSRLAEYDLTAVARNFRHWKMRDRHVMNSLRSRQDFIDGGQTASHDDRNFGSSAHFVQQIAFRLFYSFKFHFLAFEYRMYQRPLLGRPGPNLECLFDQRPCAS